MSLSSRRSTPTPAVWYADQSTNSLLFNSIGGTAQVDEGNGIKAAGFSNSYLQGGSTPDISSGDFTVEFFVKFNSSSSWQPLLYRGVPTGFGSLLLHLTNAGYLRVSRSSTGASHNVEIGSTFIPQINIWYHIAFSVSSTTGRLFVNGALVGSGAFGSGFNTNQQWLIGRYENWPVAPVIRNFTGSMAGLRITNAAVYTSDFPVPTTLPTAIPGTSLLLNFGATTSPMWFGDSSTSNNSLSSAGGVTLVDEGVGAKVANFNNSYLQGGSTPDISSGNFTVEFFVNFAANNIGFQPILSRYFPGADNRYSVVFGIQSNNTLTAGRCNTSTTPTLISTSFVPQVNVWYHIALSLVSGTARLFVNGILLGSVAWTTAYNTSQIWQVGRYQDYSSGGPRNFTGKIAGIRVVAGTGLYTTNFNVPTTLPANISGTQLLMNFTATEAPAMWLNTATTASTYLSAVTPAGIIYPNRRGELITSALFDGSGDLLRVMSSDAFTFGTDAFTVEFWVKPLVLTGERTFISTSDPTDYTGFWLGMAIDKPRLAIGYSSGWAVQTSGTEPFVINQWHHVALTCTAAGELVLYVNGRSAITATRTASLPNANNNLVIGGRTLYGQYSNSKITGIRVVKGTALYSGNFPLPATKVATWVPNTVLLLNFDSANTSPWYRDTSSRSFLPLLSGNTSQDFEDTRIVSVYTNKEGHLQTSLGTSLSSRDFDVSFFVKFDNALVPGIDQEHIVWQSSGGLSISRVSDETIKLNRVQFGDILTSTIKIQDTNWHYIQLKRASSVSTFYIDGAFAGSASDSTTYTASDFYVIPYSQASPVAAQITGLRVSRSGTLSTTVPTSAVQADANTLLLMNFGSADVPSVWYGDTSMSHWPVSATRGVTPLDEGNGLNTVVFNGTNGYLQAINTSFTSIAGDFTFETFVYPTSAVTGVSDIVSLGTYQAGVLLRVYSVPGGGDIFYVGNQNMPTAAANNQLISLSAWNHVAIVRNAGVVNLYINGLSVYSVTNSNTLNFGNIYLGTTANNPGAELYAGKMTAARLLIGRAQYTSNFAVPILPHTADSDTRLLLNFNTTAVPLTWFRDESIPSNPVSLSATPVQLYDAGNRVKAAQFNGNSYLTVYSANSGFAFGTGNWTVEFFVQMLAVPTSGDFDCWVSTAQPTDYNGIYIGVSNTRQLRTLASSSGSSWTFNGSSSTNVIALERWHHIAVVVNSGTLTAYIDGLSVISAAITVNIPNINNLMVIGGRPYASQFSSSRITGLRVVKGNAVYTSTFNPPTTLPTNITGTELLMNFGSEVWTGISGPLPLFDSSTIPNSLMLNGTVTRSIESGGVVAAALGSNGYLTTTLNDDLGSNNFTIEGFINSSSYPSNKYLIDARLGSSWAIGWGLDGSNDGALSFFDGKTSTFIKSNTIALSSTWSHFAFVRNSGTITAYLNGVNVGTASNSSNFDGTGTLTIGRRYEDLSNSFFNGSIANFRIVKGTAVYTSNFAVSATMPANITGTELLLNFGATRTPPTWFSDGSTTARAVALSGGVTRVDEGNGVIAAATSNGVLLLDNPSNNLFDFGTGDFTVDFFMKPDSLVGDGVLIDARTNVFVNNSFFVRKFGSTVQYTINNSSGSVGPTGTITSGWNHVAIVRSSGTSRMYINSLSAAEMSDTRNINTISTRVYVGAAYDVDVDFYGRIAGLRVVKGSALYSGPRIVVPSSPSTAVAGTQLLLNFGASTAPLVPT